MANNYRAYKVLNGCKTGSAMDILFKGLCLFLAVSVFYFPRQDLISSCRAKKLSQLRAVL